MDSPNRIAGSDLVTSSGNGREAAVFHPGFADGFANDSEGNAWNLRDYLWVLWKYRWLGAACFALVCGGAVAATVLMPRQYAATAKVRVTSQGPIQLQLAENVLRDENDRVVNGALVFTATQIAILQSRDLAERVIRGHRLTESAAFLNPATMGRSGVVDVAGELLGLFRPRGWKAPAPPPEHAEDTLPVEVDATLIDRYTEYLEVSEVRGTDLIEVRVTTPSPGLSAFLAGAHVQAYKEAADEALLAADVAAREFLHHHVRGAQGRLEAAEAALNRFATEHPTVTLNREEKIIAQRMAELSSLLTKAQAERLALETRYEFLTSPGGTPQYALLEQPGVQKLRFALLELSAEQAALANRLGPNHPRMRDLGTQKAALEERLTAEVAKEVSSVDAQLRAAQLNEDSLRTQLAEQEEATVELRNVETTYNLLASEVESSRALHDSLLKQQKETVVNSELAANNIRVVERPEVPRRPASPNVLLNLVLGACGGLAFAVGAALFCEHFDNSVKSSDEIEDLLQLPALATVPNFELLERGRRRQRLAGGTAAAVNGRNGHAPPSPDLIVYHQPASIASEAFRVMRTGILYCAPESAPRVILVTSSRAREGKTVTTLNLAVVLGLSGARVLVIDADLRRPGCHWALAMENVTGLSSYLAGQAELADAVRPVEGVANVSLLSAGPTPPNPAELLGSARMRAALAWARESYDFVLVDSAPTLPVTDTVVLARETDGVLFVVKGQDTPREIVRRGRDQLVAAGARFVGVVVNNVDYRNGHYYAYYGYYGPEAPAAAPTAEARA